MIELKYASLSTKIFDAEETSRTFLHKDGTKDIGMINLSGNYIQTPDEYTHVYGRNSFVNAETVLKPDGTPKY